MAHISKKLIKLARKIEREAIECGLDMCRVTFESHSWNKDARPYLALFAIDCDNKSHLWREGE